MSRLAQSLLGLLLAGSIVPAWAQSESNDETRQKINQNVVGIMAGSLGGTDAALAADMGLAFSDGYELRVVPMIGLGSVKDVEDLLYLRGVDMAIVQQDVIDFMAANNVYPQIRSTVRLIAPLSVDQFHVLASKDIRSIFDLAGKKVNYGPTDGGTFMTSSVVFDRLNIGVEITTFPHQVALEKLRSGEISAMMRASGKPVSVIEEIKSGEPFHLLEVPDQELDGIYSPTVLSWTDYPALIAPGDQVPTVAVANALIGYNWGSDHPRGKALARFSKQLVEQYGKLLEPGFHDSWSEIDISLQVPGLQRYWAIDDALQESGRKVSQRAGQ